MERIREQSEFEEKVIAIDRVSRVQKGGRRFRFRTTVVVGDGSGKVGVGVGKGGEVMTSIAKATSRAKRHMVQVPLKGTTIPHEIEVAFSGARVLLKPAAPGTGVIAGGAVRNVVEAAGIHDLLTKSLGSSNKVNTAYATFVALTSLRTDEAPRMPTTKQAADKAEKPVAEAVKPEAAAKKAPAKKPAAKAKKPASPKAKKEAKK